MDTLFIIDAITEAPVNISKQHKEKLEEVWRLDVSRYPASNTHSDILRSSFYLGDANIMGAIVLGNYDMNSFTLICSFQE